MLAATTTTTTSTVSIAAITANTAAKATPKMTTSTSPSPNPPTVTAEVESKSVDGPKPTKPVQIADITTLDDKSDNPELVQPENWRRLKSWSGRTPVFLMHDGGGTTFAYHCLEPINRFTYGIRNPFFFSQQKFEGGLIEMARLYAGWIKQTVLKDNFAPKREGRLPVEILLGGWSLGGLLSLQISKELAEDTDIHVKGILMIDSVCPTIERRNAVSKVMGSESEEGKSKNQILSSRSLTEARRMVGEWQPPHWEGNIKGQRPRVLLLKAKQNVPIENGGMSVLDIDRADTKLGWEQYDKDMIDEVIPIDGHHFNLFENAHIPGITRTIRTALIKLDAAPPPSHYASRVASLNGATDEPEIFV